MESWKQTVVREMRRPSFPDWLGGETAVAAAFESTVLRLTDSAPFVHWGALPRLLVNKPQVEEEGCSFRAMNLHFFSVTQ